MTARANCHEGEPRPEWRLATRRGEQPGKKEVSEETVVTLSSTY